MKDRQYVPLFLLRVPVRYYRQPPVYFRGWRADAPPRWGERWGHEWEQRRPGWDRWNRSAPPKAAPLPSYQQNYSGNRYPRAEEEQRDLRSKNYNHQPRHAVARQRDPQLPAVAQPQEQAQPQRRPQDRTFDRTNPGDDSQQRQRNQQRPPAAQPREHVQPQRQPQPKPQLEQQQQQRPQFQRQDPGRDMSGARRGQERDQRTREFKKDER